MGDQLVQYVPSKRPLSEADRKVIVEALKLVVGVKHKLEEVLRR